MSKKVKTRECKFVIHRPSTYDSLEDKMVDDVHFVKERVTYEDGSQEDLFRMVKNYERPFWITQQHLQRYKDKKESEPLERLRQFKTTESELWKNVGVALGGRYVGVKDKRTLAKSPYVYGTDVASKVFIKMEYLNKYPDVFTPYTVATLDIETDIETDTITIISIAREGEVYTAFLKSFVKGQKDVFKRLHVLFKENIPTDEDIKVTYKEHDDELEMFKDIMRVAHEWGPDFLAIWNMDFEMTHFIDLCSRYNVKIEDIISDPGVPREYRFFNYKRSADFKVSVSGVRKATDPQDKWNVVQSASKFYWVDAMCAYNYVRVNTKKVPTGYSLDSILNFELGSKFKKLKFKHLFDSDDASVDWHKKMARDYPLEYIVYNQWDVLSMIYLERQTNDLQVSMPTLSDISPFDYFNSGPKKIIDGLLFEYLSKGRVLGTAMPKDHSKPSADEELEDENLGLKDWIVTLANRRLAATTGGRILLENTLPTNFRFHIADAD